MSDFNNRVQVRRGTHKLAVADFETTAASYGKIPEAFVAGIMHEAEPGESPLYVSFWDDKAEDYIEPDYDYSRPDSAANQLFDYLDTLTEPHVIYFHNGGKFDIQYFAHRLPSQPVVFIGSRAVAVRYGIHEIRDSAAIVRAPLRSTGNKGTIDYAVHSKALRNAHRREIGRYLRTDCLVLLESVVAFLAECCPVPKSKIPLTVSSAAFKQLLRIEGIKMRKATGKALEIQRKTDALFRPYYIGGHVEAFEGGIIEGDLMLVDINSMYPYVMANYLHPIGDKFVKREHFTLTPDFWVPGCPDYPYFLEFEGTVKGLPRLVAMPDGTKRNDYGTHTGTHKYHSHELRVALEFGLVQIDKIICAYLPAKMQNFSKYVKRYYDDGRMKLKAMRDAGEISKDEFKARDIIAKLFLNGPYGKFAFDYRNYKEKHFINFQAGLAEAADYADGMKTVSVVTDIDTRKLYGIGETDKFSETYYSVATAASITAAARGYLLRALMTCDTPIYCDTDSIICKDIGKGVPVSDALGHWKVEARCDRVVIAGRKLYALWNEGHVVKLAAKGYSLGPKAGATEEEKRSAMDQAGLKIERAFVDGLAEKTSKRKAKKKPDDEMLIKADFMAYKLGGKHSPIARRLQPGSDALEKARKRLAQEGISHGDLYEEGIADPTDGGIWS